MFKFAFAAVVLILTPAIASAETWQVAEGAGMKTRGTWTVSVSGPSVSGNATMTDGSGRKLTYGVVGALKDGGYVIQRMRPSDGANCTYVGKPGDATTIAGNAVCNGANTPWKVTRKN